MQKTPSVHYEVPTMSIRLPDFIILGAMKAGTSTLHDHLAAHSGFFLSTPKEPCFFNRDENWLRGIEHYSLLFTEAPPNAICGESSTDYSKRPNDPQTCSRIQKTLPNVRLIYMMRHPIDRLISHYVHEWSEGKLSIPLEKAAREVTELVDYGRYAYQLEPYLSAFGKERILPVFLERYSAYTVQEFTRISRYLGYTGEVNAAALESRSNISQQRLRKNPLRDFLMHLPGATTLRRTLLPENFRERVKRRWRMESRPELSSSLQHELELRFDEDLATLGNWFGTSLNCANFKQRVLEKALQWADE